MNRYFTPMPGNSPFNSLHDPNKALPLRQKALELLIESDPVRKCSGVKQLYEMWQANPHIADASAVYEEPVGLPGRPDKPELVEPLKVKTRSMVTVEGRAALIHALAHIEFNAINLALDMVWRFADLPQAFYADWLTVAAEEAYHFTLLKDHLICLGFDYGYFSAHHGLWEMAEKTRANLLARIALVPRTLEARGLDVTPAIRAKLHQAGDHAVADILDIILRDEIGHVAIGNHWFKTLCNEHGLSTITAYAQLAKQYDAPRLRGPFNLTARRAAGFAEDELQALQQTLQA